MDCEASSLDEGGYPIEVAWLDTNGVGTSMLVRPIPAWTVWSEDSQAIHGLSRRMLGERGSDVREVVSEFRGAVGSELIATDGLAFDRHWTTMLCEAARTRWRPNLVDSGEVIAGEAQRLLTLREHGYGNAQLMELARRILREAEPDEDGIGRIHRALDDALALRAIWMRVRDLVDLELAAKPSPT